MYTCTYTCIHVSEYSVPFNFNCIDCLIVAFVCCIRGGRECGLSDRSKRAAGEERPTITIEAIRSLFIK